MRRPGLPSRISLPGTDNLPWTQTHSAVRPRPHLPCGLGELPAGRARSCSPRSPRCPAPGCQGSRAATTRPGPLGVPRVPDASSACSRMVPELERGPELKRCSRPLTCGYSVGDTGFERRIVMNQTGHADQANVASHLQKHSFRVDAGMTTHEHALAGRVTRQAGDTRSVGAVQFICRTGLLPVSRWSTLNMAVALKSRIGVTCLLCQ